MRVIDFPENRGKRAAMAAGIRATTAEIIAFVDSDSVARARRAAADRAGLRRPAVGAIAGHAEVQNARETWITRMQAVRYFVAFRVCKAAESIFGAVTCCSGCFSAYRREAIVPALERWENQRFLGPPGDLRRRPLADQLRAARLEGALRRRRRDRAHDRAGALPPVPAPAAALEALAGRASR